MKSLFDQTSIGNIHFDSFIGEYKKLTDVVHSYRTAIILQVVEVNKSKRQLLIIGKDPLL